MMKIHLLIFTIVSPVEKIIVRQYQNLPYSWLNIENFNFIVKVKYFVFKRVRNTKWHFLYIQSMTFFYQFVIFYLTF